MQVLTGQYPTLYTHKFRIFYTDFQPSTANYKDFNFLKIPASTQVLFTMIKVNQAIAGTTTQNPVLRIFDNAYLPVYPATTAQLIGAIVRGAASSTNGLLAVIPSRYRITAPTNAPVIMSVTNPTTLTIRLELVAGQVINNLTAGAWDIWITTIKMP